MPSSPRRYDVVVVGGGAAGTAAAVGAGVAAALHAKAGHPDSAPHVQQELQRQDARLIGV
jgi:thioredoxin reductase